MKYVIFKLERQLEFEQGCLKVAKKNIENTAGKNYTELEYENIVQSRNLSNERIPQIEKAIKILSQFKD